MGVRDSHDHHSSGVVVCEIQPLADLAPAHCQQHRACASCGGGSGGGGGGCAGPLLALAWAGRLPAGQCSSLSALTSRRGRRPLPRRRQRRRRAEGHGEARRGEGLRPHFPRRGAGWGSHNSATLRKDCRVTHADKKIKSGRPLGGAQAGRSSHLWSGGCGPRPGPGPRPCCSCPRLRGVGLLRAHELMPCACELVKVSDAKDVPDVLLPPRVGGRSVVGWW